jgi:hypothetical protein
MATKYSRYSNTKGTEMTDLRTAAQSALEVLEDSVPTGRITLIKFYDAMHTLRAALAQPTQPQGDPLPSMSPPVASICRLLNQAMDQAVANGANSVSMLDDFVEIAVWLSGAPQQVAQPLSDEEFFSLVDSEGIRVDPSMALTIKEIVERAHGIGEQPCTKVL